MVTDLQETKDALVKASDLPLSILIVGVGGADFKEMEVFTLLICSFTTDIYTAFRWREETTGELILTSWEFVFFFFPFNFGCFWRSRLFCPPYLFSFLNQENVYV